MSNIDAQIKALQLKKKQIDYVAYITDLVKNDTKCIDFKDVKDEVLKKVLPFLKELAESIERGAEVKPHQPTPIQSQNGAFNQETSPPSSSQIQSQPTKKPENMQDKMNFAMSNRHLANKRVQILNDEKALIYGNVVGLDAPFVIVKTETGPTIQVPLEKVVPQ